MAKKNTASAKGTEKKVSGYVVAAGHAYTSKGVMYDEGDAITAAAFASEADFKAEIANKGIVAADVAAADVDDENEDDSEKDTGTSEPTKPTEPTGNDAGNGDNGNAGGNE